MGGRTNLDSVAEQALEKLAKARDEMLLLSKWKEKAIPMNMRGKTIGSDEIGIKILNH